MSGKYEIIDEQARRSPDEKVIDRIRQRYPVEREMDVVYSRKMRRRHGPIFEGVTLEQLIEGTRALIASQVGYPVAIEQARWLSGGASKLQMEFHLKWRGPGGDVSDEKVSHMVLRMEPAASVTESSRIREYEVLRAVEGVIPAPVAHWVDAEPEYLPYPAIVYDFVTGSAKPSYDAGKVSGLGQNYGPDLRAKLCPQFVGLLARLHRIELEDDLQLNHFDRPAEGTNEGVIIQVNAMRRVWEEDRVEEEPIMEIIYRWLIDNAPPIDHVSIVHGDYRSGNFLFDEENGQITAWLDWEGALLGDRHRDLTYAALPSFQHYAEDGLTPLASGMMTAQQLYAAYEIASGLSVDPDRIAYYEVFNRYLVVVLTGAAAARASREFRTHQDVLVNYVTNIGYIALSDLREKFLELIA